MNGWRALHFLDPAVKFKGNFALCLIVFSSLQVFAAVKI